MRRGPRRLSPNPSRANDQTRAAVTMRLGIVFLVAWTAKSVKLGHGNVVERAELIKDAYDYVIVGAGTAGLTLADRLTESGKCEDFNGVIS